MVRRLLSWLRRLVAHFWPRRRSKAGLTLPPRYLRRHMRQAVQPTHRGRRARANIIRLAARKGV